MNRHEKRASNSARGKMESAIVRVLRASGVRGLKELSGLEAARILLREARTQNKIGNVSDDDVRSMAVLVHRATLSKTAQVPG